jgi:glutathionyl-hydroquinone reductase
LPKGQAKLELVYKAGFANKRSSLNKANSQVLDALNRLNAACFPQEKSKNILEADAAFQLSFAD